MKKSLVCLAIVVLVVFGSSCGAVSKETNSSSSIIGDDEALEFLMDSHSTRILQSVGSKTQNSLVGGTPFATCGRGLPYGGCTPSINQNQIPENCVYPGNRNRNCRP
ncbi:hypothetical protein V6N13_127943 [Hibiscus sabdariffa]|uniref:Uncharacterized protein n=2 Tax=Hibiscus sabdariffa TaxID=183260 RepID=A0ABR2ADT9_9ROSI